jgi:hypothetical protein
MEHLHKRINCTLMFPIKIHQERQFQQLQVHLIHLQVQAQELPTTIVWYQLQEVHAEMQLVMQ